MKAVLFDLDGTLLPLDTLDFVAKYFQAVSRRFEHLLPSHRFRALLWQAVTVMIDTDHPDRTNQEVFVDAFCKLSGLRPEEFMPLFERFYSEDFPLLRNGVVPNPRAVETVELARKLGFKVVLATNPVYPATAILQRLEWAGLSPLHFDFITTYEQMHACKPSVRYYQEVLDLVGCAPEHCLMVGNDTLEDMVAGQLGMLTYLVQDFAIESTQGIQPHFRGSWPELKQLLLGLAVRSCVP
ncbi:MAG: HAD family hydrolase [Bacillota bacterium]